MFSTLVVAFMANHAWAIQGHESGGRQGAATIHVKISNTNPDLAENATKAFQLLAKEAFTYNQIQEYLSDSDEYDKHFCISFKDNELRSYVHRYNFQKAFSRFLVHSGTNKAVVTTAVTASPCSDEPSYYGTQLGAYNLPHSNRVTLKCQSMEDLPFGYHATLSFIERANSDGTYTTDYTLEQVSENARFAQLTGTITEVSATVDDLNINLTYHDDTVTLDIFPTIFQKIDQYVTYQGMLSIDERTFKVACESK